jgi:hypothetical protein
MGVIHTMNRCLIDAVPDCGRIVRLQARTTWNSARPSNCLRCRWCPGELDGDSTRRGDGGSAGLSNSPLSLSATAHDDDVLWFLSAAARLAGR